MITDLQSIIKKQGWQQSQLVDTDFWIGRRQIRHINRVMPIEGGVLYVEYNEYYDVWYEKIEDCPTKEAVDFSNLEIVFASTQAEAINDLKDMEDILKKEKQTKIKKTKADILKGVSIIQDSIQDSCDDYRVIEAALKQLDCFHGDEFYKFRNFLRDAGFCDAKAEKYDEDLYFEIKDIYQQHGFFYRDKDSTSDGTFVDLNHAVSVEKRSKQEGEDYIHIEMANGKSFNVYEEDEEDLFFALSILYR